MLRGARNVRSRSSRLSTTSFASIGLPLPAPRSQGAENRCRNQRYWRDEDEHGNDEVRLLPLPAPRSQGTENRCRNQRYWRDEDEHGNDEVRLLQFPPEVLQPSAS
jgi:hypothetical protein